LKFVGSDDLVVQLKRLISDLNSKLNTIHAIASICEDISINIYIRSEYGQIGYSIPQSVLYPLAELGLDINFHILSFGGAEVQDL
jgi:hypothetical protein